MHLRPCMQYAFPTHTKTLFVYLHKYAICRCQQYALHPFPTHTYTHTHTHIVTINVAYHDYGHESPQNCGILVSNTATNTVDYNKNLFRIQNKIFMFSRSQLSLCMPPVCTSAMHRADYDKNLFMSHSHNFHVSQSQLEVSQSEQSLLRAFCFL
jgi:hypothetical protein